MAAEPSAWLYRNVEAGPLHFPFGPHLPDMQVRCVCGVQPRPQGPALPHIGQTDERKTAARTETTGIQQGWEPGPDREEEGAASWLKKKKGNRKEKPAMRGGMMDRAGPTPRRRTVKSAYHADAALLRSCETIGLRNSRHVLPVTSQAGV